MYALSSPPYSMPFLNSWHNHALQITGEELTHRSDDLSVEGIEARFHCYQNYGSSVSSFFRVLLSSVAIFCN